MELHGRGRECEAIDALIDAARESSSGCLTIHGESGTGKTALLAYAAERADGFQVLRASGAPSEFGLPYAGLHQLLRPALGRLDALPGVQRAAVSGALGLAAGDGADRFLIALAALSLLSELAEAGPVLAAVDDLQWLDRESADTLRFVERRIGAEGIALVLATRRPAGPDGGLTIVGLDRVAADGLLIERIGVTPAPEVRAFLWEQTRGNPAALIEVAGALTTEQLAGAAPIPDDITSPAVPDDTRTLLLVAAAEGTGDIAVILRAAAALGVEPAALEPAEVAGIVHVEANRLVFRERPTAIYERAPFGRRQAAHRAIAEALGPDEDRRVWHRSAATVGPDDEVADELERFADRARARGGHAAASSALERAADLTSERVRAGRRLATAAGDSLMAGHGQAAAALAAQASVDDPELDFTRARIEAGAGNRRIGFDLMLSASEAVEPARAARMLGEAGRIAWMDAEPQMMAEVGRRLDSLELDGDAPERFAVDLMQGLFRHLQGEPRIIADAIDRVDPGDPQQLHLAGVASMFMRDDRTARALLARALARARDLGAIALVPRILVPAALLETWEGAYPAARAHAAEGERLALDTGQDHLLAYFVGVQAWIAAVRGQEDACAELSRRTLELGHAHRVKPSIAIGIWAAALSEIGAGRWADGATRLEAVVPPGAPDGHPVIGLQASADLIEAAQRAERPELAREIVAAYAPFAGVAPWTLALLARGRALVAEDATAVFEEALSHHAHSERRFEEARTRLVYGEHLRRLKRRTDARAQLRSAIDVFERLGAEPWAERARTELRATGETARKRDPSTLDQLTPQEMQIVRRVAEGASNKAVAAQLFLSPRTVAYHLRNVFVKLGISSRTELMRLDLD